MYVQVAVQDFVPEIRSQQTKTSGHVEELGEITALGGSRTCGYPQVLPH